MEIGIFRALEKLDVVCEDVETNEKVVFSSFIDSVNAESLFICVPQREKEELKSSLEEHLSNDDANKAYNEMWKDIDEGSIGRSALLSSGQVVLWGSDANDKGTLAHEIFHCVCFIMEKVGICLCHESDEAYAYLIGFITNKVNDALKE